ncbi:MAG: 2Fe-2S iron-sulfur cluster binding domain-containing protein, partial [Actinomycetia bacterium]|nr:2Fe-2S iron-sulfur cluster binding domain-containing protein [Actinomycetes bacterium]
MADGTPVTITVDGREVEARPGEMLITAAQRAGTHIPHFCHHDRMQPVGMCRMCLVDVDTGRGPMLQPSCMVPVGDGMVVDTKSDRTERAQEGILELLLVNHPLDCPVCDKGGECPLQDQTFAYGPGESRFVEEKRHYEKPIAISDNIYLDRERCILCDRCTRFADEVAGDPLIHFIERGNQTQVNTFPDEPFSSYFSGNTVQACPVGALTAKPFRFKARPWDLDSVESTSTTDSVGSRIVIQSSRDEVVRYLGVDSDPVNWGWLSDKERFSFEYVNSDERLTAPLHADGDELAEITWSAALAAAAEALDSADPTAVGFVGGSRLTNEAQYAWTRLAKGVVGTDNVDAQLADGLPPELVLGLPRATIDEACAKNGTIILLGPDPKEELGALFLRLRHAVVFDGARLIELTPRASGLSGQAQVSLYARPGEQAAVAHAVASGEISGDVAGVAEADLRAAHELVAADGPVTVVLGRTSVAEHA